jgi:hypothetical protein
MGEFEKCAPSFLPGWSIAYLCVSSCILLLVRFITTGQMDANTRTVRSLTEHGGNQQPALRHASACALWPSMRAVLDYDLSGKQGNQKNISNTTFILLYLLSVNLFLN